MACDTLKTIQQSHDELTILYSDRIYMDLYMVQILQIHTCTVQQQNLQILSSAYDLMLCHKITTLKKKIKKAIKFELLERNSNTGTATLIVVDILLISNKTSGKFRSITSGTSNNKIVSAYTQTIGVRENKPVRNASIISF